MARRMIKSKPKATEGSSAPIIDEEARNFPTLPEIIGLPPSTGSGIGVTDSLISNSSLVLKITPCEAKFEAGMSLFKLEPSWAKYKDLLSRHKFTPNASHDQIHSISVAVQADSFPTDAFTNEYGEHFLNKLTDVAGSAFGEVAQMMGKKNASEALQEMGKSLGKADGAIGAIGSVVESAGNVAAGLRSSMEKAGGVIGGMAGMADRLLAGARIDFPLVWKNSSYAPSYSFNIRLWNPDPGNEETTNKYIIGPLAALLLLALPQTTEEQEDSSSYNWPFFCKVNCKGLFKIQAGAITNISITKGGEGGQIAFNQRLGLVDVRIDFINLHSSLIVSRFGHDSRPTLQGYLNNLKESSSLIKIYEKEDFGGEVITNEQKLNPSSGGPERFRKLGDLTTLKPSSGGPTRLALDITTPPISRITDAVWDAVGSLVGIKGFNDF